MSRFGGTGALTRFVWLEVAGDVGYESEAAFNRALRREFGVPPGRFRRKERPSPGRHKPKTHAIDRD